MHGDTVGAHSPPALDRTGESDRSHLKRSRKAALRGLLIGEDARGPQPLNGRRVAFTKAPISRSAVGTPLEEVLP